MKNHDLHSWKQYLSKTSYQKLLHNVENAKKNKFNKKIIILSGSGKNGKTTLLHEIMFYLNIENCYEYDISKDDYYGNKTKKNVIIHGGIENVNQTLLNNLLEDNVNIFCCTKFLDFVEPNILAHSHIINMKHVFNN